MMLVGPQFGDKIKANAINPEIRDLASKAVIVIEEADVTVRGDAIFFILNLGN